jgi:hypothetical protein
LKLQVAGVSEAYGVVKLFDVLFCSVLGTTRKVRHLDTFEKYIHWETAEGIQCNDKSVITKNELFDMVVQYDSIEGMATNTSFHNLN